MTEPKFVFDPETLTGMRQEADLMYDLYISMQNLARVLSAQSIVAQRSGIQQVQHVQLLNALSRAHQHVIDSSSRLLEACAHINQAVVILAAPPELEPEARTALERLLSNRKRKEPT
jgi:hypothetical protein